MSLRPVVLAAVLALLASAPGAVAQCNAPPVPAAGRTVTWLRAESPFEVCGTLTIPAGGTVVVEPGVTVTMARDATMDVEGTIQAAGTPAAPITFGGVDVWPPILRVAGTLELRHGIVTGQVRPLAGGTLLFEATTFRGHGMVLQPDLLNGGGPPFLSFEACRFEGSSPALSAHHCTLVVRDCDFVGTGLWTMYSYAWLDDIRVDGAPGDGISIAHDDQPFFLDGITARNCARGGIQVGGAQAGNDFFLGSRNVLEGNQFPVVVGDGGLLPGSVVPTAGNFNDVVLIDPGVFPRGPMTLPLLPVAYLVRDSVTLGHGLDIHPGVVVRFGPDAGLIAQGGNLRARGTRSSPIRLVPDDPAVAWGAFGAQSGDSKLEHVFVTGAAYGITAAGALVHVESCVLRENGWGVQASGYNPIRVRGTSFERNDVGAITDLLLNSPGFLDLHGGTNPNSFTGNRVAVQGGDGLEDARLNWWGSATGPDAPGNPPGTGDPIGPEVLYAPFRTEAPDRTTAPPFVTVSKMHFLLEPGSRQVVRWEVDAERPVVSQRVVLARAGEYEFDVVLADGLPPGERQLAFTVPEVGYQVTCLPAYVRVVAVDDLGREGWDQSELSIRSDDWIAQVRVTSSHAGTYRPGDQVDVCFETDAPEPWLTGSPYAFLLLDGDRWTVPLGGPATSTGCLPLGLTMPMVSTDSARIGVRVSEGCNRIAWGFSECFAIRPDPRVPDAAPTLSVTSPAEGEVVPAGGVVPIRWTAADDEAVRSFDVMGSYDGGRTWHELAADLPPTSTGWDWDLPAGEELPDLRVRVVVRDLRFQETWNGCGVGVRATSDCVTDADGDGRLGCDDCAPGDVTAWSLPGEARALMATSKTTFEWRPPADPGATVVWHDVLRTRVPSDFQGAATCVETAGDDLSFSDPELPGGSPGLFCYLVRARNGCSAGQAGTLGRSSLGVERSGRACP